MLRSMSTAAVKTFISDPATVNRLHTHVATFAAHSVKATFLSELAHAHADPQVLMSQGHWKTPEMPAKYTRNRQAISVKGVKEIITNLKAKWEGEDVNSGIVFSEDEEDETVAESLVFDQACAPRCNSHDKDVRQHRVEKLCLSDVTLAEQASQNKIARSKARSKDEPGPDQSFFATRAALDSKRISCEVTYILGRSAWTD